MPNGTPKRQTEKVVQTRIESKEWFTPLDDVSSIKHGIDGKASVILRFDGCITQSQLTGIIADGEFKLVEVNPEDKAVRAHLVEQ